MPNPVIHWEITGKDAPKLQEFYSGLFGWNVSSDNPINYGLVDTQTGEGINGGIAQEQGEATRVTVYVQVDDLQAYLDKAESLGGKTILPPMEIPGIVTLAMFQDPEGNVIGLVTG